MECLCLVHHWKVSLPFLFRAQVSNSVQKYRMLQFSFFNVLYSFPEMTLFWVFFSSSADLKISLLFIFFSVLTIDAFNVKLIKGIYLYVSLLM